MFLNLYPVYILLQTLCSKVAQQTKWFSQVYIPPLPWEYLQYKDCSSLRSGLSPSSRGQSYQYCHISLINLKKNFMCCKVQLPQCTLHVAFLIPARLAVDVAIILFQQSDLHPKLFFHCRVKGSLKHLFKLMPRLSMSLLFESSLSQHLSALGHISYHLTVSVQLEWGSFVDLYKNILSKQQILKEKLNDASSAFNSLNDLNSTT